jgi:hypothetical protein
LCYVFIDNPISRIQKQYMLGFAVVTNGLSGVRAGIHMIYETFGTQIMTPDDAFNALPNITHDPRIVLLLLPLWNIGSCFMLLMLVRMRLIDGTIIRDANAAPLQILLGVGVLSIAFALCELVFKLHWSITFSICVAYATTLSEPLSRIVVVLRRRSRRTAGIIAK